MAYRCRIHCYVCENAIQIQQMARINGDDNAIKRQIAISRRDNLGKEYLHINNESRLCFNCNKSIVHEMEQIENDPTCLRLNVITQTQNNSCLFCNSVVNVRRLSLESRVNVFVLTNIYIPEYIRCCDRHLDNRGFILPLLLSDLLFINRPFVIKGQQLQVFLQALRNVANNKNHYEDENSFTEDEFKSIAPITKQQFQELYTYCDPVPHEHGIRNVSKKDLLTFLCKLRQGLFDEFLRVLFQYPSRQKVSLAISKVRQSLLKRFVLDNIGFQAITREEYIMRHITPFANDLYNPQANIPKVIAYIDGTYSYIHKSSNFCVLRQTYSMHKGRHLVKPALIVAPDGYILAIQGPYFSDSCNNDAQMLNNEFQRDAENIRRWFHDGDIFILDRGYRDAQPLLRELGIEYKMPAFLGRNQKQLSTEEANEW
ncbi:uncharacterized protein LOC116851665 [Odontomachus brunneus]|uniref:uncharacterized protein LOC116851665 n=1 Tax=Odontomachus brunneus TaxID=486640 RepID=UPI0013F20A70|nr:uncharacterized protein LOC116851665 [Odontomachus brunneus]